MTKDFIVVIPARFGSTRFPGKPLVAIQSKPMIQHVHERALESGAKSVWVATDDERIAEAASAFGAQVCMTSDRHQSGTDRIVEVVQKQQWPDDTIIVNVQGDEPFIPSENIQQVAHNLAVNPAASMSTLSSPENIADINNPNMVKVVSDRQGMALYFSRAPVPYGRDEQATTFARHIGLYAYRVDYLKRFAEHEMAPIEAVEKLEQLRALWYGEKIHVETAKIAPPVGIDTPEDLEKLL